MNPKDKFLMCPPRFYAVEYVINPWMEGNVGRTNPEAAREQWQRLHETLKARAEVELIDPVQGLPDMTFTANSGLVVGKTFVPARFRYAQREPETGHFVRWLESHGLQIAELGSQGTFEGEGDALLQPGEALLWCGYGVRSSLLVCSDLSEILGVEVIPLRLVDERFYHLDTCFCPLPGGKVIYYPEAFDQESVRAIRRRVKPEDLFEAGNEDALNFACNAIVTGDAYVTNFAGRAMGERLARWGYEVILCPLDQFILAGGSAKCLALGLHAPLPPRPAGISLENGVCQRTIEIEGQLLDTDLMTDVLDCITDGGCSFEIDQFQAGLRHDQKSRARIRVVAPTTARLEAVAGRLIQMGARATESDADARFETVRRDGVAPPDFYSTTIFPTDVRIEGRWVRALGQRMDAVLVVRDEAEGIEVRCTLMRDLRTGDRVVSGVEGIRISAPAASRPAEMFGFMSSGVSSERRVEVAVEATAWEMKRIRERGGKIVVVAGPVLIHTGGGPYLARLIRLGYVQVLLGGNAIAVHDVEQALFGTSLGVDLKRGANVPGGHRNHLQAINLIRECGGIGAAVEQGRLRSGVMFECIRGAIPYALAGSIRDDGPLPETMMDLVEAQREYARLIEGADMILMLASMLHSIGVGNMTPAGVRLICVDISPAVMTKLTDRGSVESTGIVTDVGLFLNLLASRLDDGA